MVKLKSTNGDRLTEGKNDLQTNNLEIDLLN